MLVAAFPDWVREDFFHADGNDIFVMGTVEDGDLPFGGDFLVNAPQEIVVQFLSSGFFEGGLRAAPADPPGRRHA